MGIEMIDWSKNLSTKCAITCCTTPLAVLFILETKWYIYIYNILILDGVKLVVEELEAYLNSTRPADKKPCPATLIDDGTIYWRESYGRGVGRIPDKTPRPAGMRDDGVRCWRDSYGRAHMQAICELTGNETPHSRFYCKDDETLYGFGRCHKGTPLKEFLLCR